MKPHDYLTERQWSWARRHGIALDDAGYTEELNDNLFLPLTAEAAREFPRGLDGGLDDGIHAAHSSAALVVNVFNYWRLYRDLGPILSALCPDLADHKVEDIRFEAPCPIAWPVLPQARRRPPQLDVLIRYRSMAEPEVTKAIAIESKFREPYGSHRDEFATCYLSDENTAIWDGFEPLRQLALRIQNNEVPYQRLHVAQLIKHVLGINSVFGGTTRFELLYLWYPAPGREAVQHEEEIADFDQLVKSCRTPVNFRAVRYDDLINALAHRLGDAHGAYLDYLLERYF